MTAIVLDSLDLSGCSAGRLTAWVAPSSGPSSQGPANVMNDFILSCLLVLGRCLVNITIGHRISNIESISVRDKFKLLMFSG